MSGDKKKIVFVSHCVLNTASKVFYHNKLKIKQEESTRKRFLKEVAEEDIQLIQLPCPEFLMYGSERWGHTKNQFDNPFFREKCREILELYILQMKSYLSHENKFKILGVVGIEGSPTCGVNKAFCGNWGGELSSCNCIEDIVKGGQGRTEKGVLMEVLEQLMKENDIKLPIVPLKASVLSKFLKEPKN